MRHLSSYKVQQNITATVKMLTTTTYNGPAFNTRSKTSHQCPTTANTELLSTQPIKETVTPDLTTVKTTEDVTPKPLTDGRHEALIKVQKTYPFCKCISKWLSNGKAPKHKT